MLTILGKAGSINVRKVLWTCAELGLKDGRDYSHDASWGGDGRSTRDPAFLALNPHGLVPVLRDSDVVLWESNAIVRYLIGRHGRPDLLPTDSASRAKVEMWMDWQLGDFNGAWRYAYMALVRNPAAFTNQDEIDRSIADWTAKIAVLEQQLQRSRAYVTGAAFNAADIVIGLSVNRWFMTPLEQYGARPDFPAVSAYYDRLSERPGFMQFGRNGQP